MPPPVAPEQVSPGLVDVLFAVAALLLLATAYWLGTQPEGYYAVLPLLAFGCLVLVRAYAIPKGRQLIVWQQVRYTALEAQRDQQRTEADACYQKLAQQHQRLVEELETMRQKTGQQSAEIGDLRQAKAQLEQDRSELENVTVAHRAQIGQMESQAGALQATIGQLTADLANEKATVSKLGQALDNSEQAHFTATKRHQNFLKSVRFGIARFEVTPPINIHHEPEKQIRELYQQARLIDANQPLAVMSGYGSPAGMLDMTFGSLFKNPQGKHAMSQMRQMVQHGHHFTDEDSLEADANDRLVRYQKNYACVIENGFVTDVWYTKTNVSALKEELAGAVANERFYRMLLDNQDEPVAALDENGNIKYLSEPFFRTFGHRLPDHKQKAFISLFPPDEAGPVLKAMNAVFSQVDEPAYTTARIRLAGGGDRETELTVRNCLAKDAVGALVVSVRDVTERNRERRAATAREQFLTQVANVAPHPILVIDPQQALYFANQLGQALIDQYSLPKILAQIAAPNPLLQGPIYEQANLILALDSGGQGTAYFLRDVTREQANWQSLGVEKELWHQLAQCRGESVVLLDQSGTLRVATNNLAAHLGGAVAIGSNLSQYFDQSGHAAFDLTRRQSGSPIQADFYIQLPGSGPQWIEALFTNLEHVGAVNGIIMAFRQRTDQKVRIDALTQNERYFRTLCTFAPPPLAIASAQGQYLWATPRTLALFACETGQSIDQATWLQDHQHSLAQLYRGELDQFQLEAGPTAERYDLTLARQRGSDGTMFMLITGENVTERLALQQQLAQTTATMVQELADKAIQVANKEEAINLLTADLGLVKQKLIASEKLASIGRLASGLAQHLQQPIAASLGLLPQVLGDVADLQSLIDRYAELNLEIDFAAKWAELRAFREILGLDTLSRDIENGIGQLGLNLTQVASQTKRLANFADTESKWEAQVDLTDIVGEVLDLLAPKIGRQVEVQTSLGSGLVVSGNPSLLAQLLLNVIDNALDALAVPRPNIAASLIVQTQQTGTGPMICVIDNGPGMDESMLANLFVPFFTTKDPTQHLGLGLSIAKSIAELHQGRIEIRSQIGQGTTVEVHL